MTNSFGIDISKWQGINNFAKIKANTSFVLVKATESWGYTDPMFRANWQGLAGHNRGAYSYIWLSDDPLRQANHLIDIVTQAGVDWRYDRLALDLEKSGHGLSKAEVARRVIVMMERIKEVTGRYPILYSRATWVDSNMLVTDPRIADADWWLAHYLWRRPSPLFTPEKDPPPALPRGVNNWLIHQTAEKQNGSAVGVASHYVDTNRWNGTKQELLAYFGLTEETEPMPPEPEPDALFQAKVVTISPNRLRTRYSPAGVVRPEADWYKSGRVVSVYETVPDWYRTAAETWASKQWMQRLDTQPPVVVDLPVYSQKDPRWGTDRMGASDFTIAEKGCLITITAAGLSYLGYPITPKEYNSNASTKGGYQLVKEGKVTYANMYWQFPDVLTNHQIVRAEYSWIYFNQGWQKKVDAILASKRPVWTEVRLNGYQHWVLVVGKADDKYLILDPWHGDIADMSTRYDRVYRIVSYRRQGSDK